MKFIVAFIPPTHLQKTVNALVDRHIHGLSVSESKGFGQEHDSAQPQKREYIGIELTKKLRLEIACHDDEVNPILDAIYRATHTGLRGNGKVFVLPVLDAMRLKTGERGEAALGPELE